MPKRKCPPSYRLHKARNCAVVTIRGKNHYLGPYGSDESYELYARLIAERFPNGTPTSAGLFSKEELTVSQLILRYWTEHVRPYYSRDGNPTERQYHIRQALRPVRALYGGALARDFGPMALHAVREAMIADGQKRGRDLNRKYINDHVGITKAMFRWAVAHELVPVTVHQALQAVENVRKGREPRLQESRKVLPAPEEDVQAVLKVVTPQIRAMIELQMLTGMRPDEVTIMRPCDIDRTGEVWFYIPERHKMGYKDLERVIPLGPRAQETLTPWLKRGPACYFFSPREVAEANRSKHRKNSNKTGPSKPKTSSTRAPREHYDDESYCQAVERACTRAGVPKWTPGQLRHNAATVIRRLYGLDAARLILGHRSASTTEIYAEKNKADAARIMKEIG